MTTEKQPLPPKDEWVNLSLSQLYDLKTELTNRYFDMRQVNASFASQFLIFSQTVDSIIAHRQMQQMQSVAEAHRG